jgi:hypothetical protein
MFPQEHSTTSITLSASPLQGSAEPFQQQYQPTEDTTHFSPYPYISSFHSFNEINTNSQACDKESTFTNHTFQVTSNSTANPYSYDYPYKPLPYNSNPPSACDLLPQPTFYSSSSVPGSSTHSLVSTTNRHHHHQHHPNSRNSSNSAINTATPNRTWSRHTCHPCTPDGVALEAAEIAVVCSPRRVGVGSRQGVGAATLVDVGARARA